MEQKSQVADYALPPIVHPAVHNLLQDCSADLFKLIGLKGSPIHLVFPQIMLETTEEFRRVLDVNTASGSKIYFAAKANKANAFLAACPIAEIGADVSSAQEFMAALSAGIQGGSISVSGPAKQSGLMALAILHNAKIAIDEPHDLSSVIELATHLPIAHRVRVLLRLSASDTSRFGMEEAEIDEVLGRLTHQKSRILLEGFSFHISVYSSAKREAMIGMACEAIKRAYVAGMSPTHINIGGGFRTAYADHHHWDMRRATEREFAGGVKPQFVYPYATQPSGYAQLEAILRTSKSTVDDTAVATGRPLTIDIEPGRSLLDQAGVSVFRVQGVRRIGKRWLVMVDGSSRNLSEFWRNSEFFIDPFIMTNEPREAELFTAAVASNTCLESDYLARRFIPFSTRPEPGDLLVYVNTAGYQMDSKESDFHRVPTPGKVVALLGPGGWRFVDDYHVSAADLVHVTAKDGRS